MSAADFLRAGVAALAILVLNVAISVLAVAVYSYVFEPGQSAEFYEASAQQIAPWSSVVAGGPLFALFAFALGRRRTKRPATTFALTMFGAYAAIDLAIIAGAGALNFKLLPILALSLTTKLAGALLGARLSRRGHAPSPGR